MSYVDPDYPTKKAFKAAMYQGVVHRTYNPSGLFPTPQDGDDVIEGPHYPKAHQWYAGVKVEDGIVVEITS